MDFVHPESDLSPYKLVIVPNLYLTRNITVENLTRYVENGGTLVVSFFSGIVDEHDHIPPGAYPAPLRRLLGLHVEEFAPIIPGQVTTLAFDGETVTADLWSDVITLENAQALATFTSGFANSCPAITLNAFGKGRAYYVGTRPSPATLQKLYNRILQNLDITPVLIKPSGVEATQRGDYLFLLNHTCELITLTLDGRAWLYAVTSQPVTSNLNLPPYGGLILRLDQPS